MEAPDFLFEYPACRKASVDFAIFSDAMDPLEVSSDLQLEPTSSWRKGQLYSSGDGARLLTRTGGAWHFETCDHVQSKSMEKHILFLLEKIEPAQGALTRYLDDPGYTVRCLLWWDTSSFHGGFEVSSSALARLAAVCSYFQMTCIFDPEADAD